MIQKMEDLKLESYGYSLPAEFIAQKPAEARHDSKLLVYNATTGEIAHAKFWDLGNYLPPQATLVLNRSKVFPCRLMAQKRSGGKAEIFLLDVHTTDKRYPNCYPALIRATHKKREGDVFVFAGGVPGEIVEATVEVINKDGTFLVSFNRELSFVLEKFGKVPIPPYIREGIADSDDLDSYQTIFAQEVGSVAAPTAGLHFSEELFARLEKQNITRAFLTLHVGVGTFAPVKSEEIRNHQMHKERYFVEALELSKIESCFKEKRPLIAVGTTSLRSLESTYNKTSGQLAIKAGQLYETDIFIYPGHEFRTINGLITNFHLPKSSLLMLVSALIGREKTLELYEIAKEHNYRFFSYGDAMLILR